MAQTLKPDLREKIIEAGKREFISCGYRDSSMRRIAESCGISVGNLYTYFSGKKQLLDTITTETLNSIEQLVSSLSGSRISLHRTALGISAAELKQVLGVFSERLAGLFIKDREAMLILLMNEEMDRRLCVWFTGLLKNIITKGDEQYDSIMAESIAISIFEGIKSIFEQFRDADLKDLANLSLFKKLIADYMTVFGFIFDSYSMEGI
ncbi:MAG: TetR/AcrR family transcriptional regulator [Erysipelotrichaceae bacterium]|nr:TetR/AcrR family transcriptional regulator [Erysipelotrichaceae bacterium]